MAGGWDVFVSHASEDKVDVVHPLVAALKSAGLRVWYDRAELTLGDSLRRKIDEGLAECRFGIVVLSKSFFAKHWPQVELDGLAAREVGGTKVILPIWHLVDFDMVQRASPPLAMRLAVNWSTGLENVVDQVLRVVGPARTAQQTDLSEGPPTPDGQRVQISRLYDLLLPAMSKLDARMAGGGAPRLTTGYADLDKLLIDLSSHRLIVIGGRPGMGKTGLLLGLIVHTIASRVPAGLISLDASQAELVDRLLAIQARLDLKRMVRGAFSDQEYERVAGALGPLGDAPLAIAEAVGMEISQIAEAARKMKETLGIRLLFVDGYDNIYRTSGGSPARSLHVMAREAEMPVIVTAEVSRAVEERPDKRPLRSDLADDDLESEADSIMFVYRPSYYRTTSEMESEGEVIVVKNRFGTRGIASLTWDHASASFLTQKSAQAEG